jgi:hypothetical protein
VNQRTPYLAINTVKIAGLGGEEINALGQAEPPGIDRSEEIFHRNGFTGRQGERTPIFIIEVICIQNNKEKFITSFLSSGK